LISSNAKFVTTSPHYLQGAEAPFVTHTV
jgi:hypothetical protein